MVTAKEILQVLPPFRNERIMVKRNQRVGDIIEQILVAHEKYAHYYDKICGFFDADTTQKICDNLYNFLQKNVRYVEESDDEQTTALPSAILTLAHGDCKHYSLFCNGVLDALKRKGKKIEWLYRFCSYKPFDQTPHHVFCVVKDEAGEIWVDPVPGANELTPTWQIDKTVKTKVMPLYDVIGNTKNVGSASIGYTVAETLAHTLAKVSMLPGRAAFLLMLRYNVKNWAKDLYSILWTHSTPQAWDNIGKKWYLLGGDAQPFKDAILEGKDKKMIGSASVGAIDVVAAIAAAAPVIIAMVPIVRDLLKTINPNLPANYEPGMVIPGNTTTFPGTTPTTNTGLSNLFSNPLFLAAGAGLGYYFLTKKKSSKVNGTDNTIWLLALLGGGLYLYNKSKQTSTQQTIEQPPIVPVDPVLTNDQPQPVTTTEPTTTTEPGAIEPVRDYAAVDLYNSNTPEYKADSQFDYTIPVEAYFQ